MSSATIEDGVERRELAHRRSDGIDVSLLWIGPAESLTVMVLDQGSGASFELVVENGTEALDVFRHPFAYAAWRGVDYGIPGESVAA